MHSSELSALRSEKEALAQELAASIANNAIMLELASSRHAAELVQVNNAHNSLCKDLNSAFKSELLASQKETAAFEMKVEALSEELNTAKVTVHAEREAARVEIANRDAQSALLASELDICKHATSRLEEKLSSATSLAESTQAALITVEAELAMLQKSMDLRVQQAIELQQIKFNKDLEKAVADSVAEKDKYIARYTKENLLRKKIHNKLLELQGNIRVLCRVRPILDIERKQGAGLEVDVTDIPNDQDIIVTKDEQQRTKFEYDHVFSQVATQVEVFDAVRPLCVSVLDGFNVAIFAYGQTGKCLKDHALFRRFVYDPQSLLTLFPLYVFNNVTVTAL